MKKHLITSSLFGLALAMGSGLASAAAPDWSKVASQKITIFYPGVSAIDWITKGTAHGGARAFKKGERCVDCHSDEAADIGKKIVSGQKNEPAPIKGKAGSIPVEVQAANDGTNLYLRFTWKQPAASGAAKMDKDNPVKLAFMLADDKIKRAEQSGCWETCHGDARTMPGAADTRTKYVSGGDVKSGVFYDLIQWKSNGKPVDGYIADQRVMEGGKGLVEAKGEKKGDTWTVTITRKLSADGVGDIKLASGKVYNFGFAIHDDSSLGRFHHVSLGYTLGIDTKADVAANKQ